ncbi:MAG: hypothetical protein HOV80_36050 [Polyangiaceae bacterium]|nr:hypothetical protein [Polyangiaceae bacterium]
MRLAHGFALVATITLPSVLAVACFDAVNDCERNANLPCYAEATGGSSGTGLPPGCDPVELEGGALGDACGVFVNPSVAPGGSGTQSSPFSSIAEAIAGSSGKAIFVCATAGDLVENVEISAGVQLFGGLTCEDWKVASTRTSWTAKADAVPLKLLATPSAHVQGFDIVAKPGSGIEPTTLAGKSSIAVIAENANATFVDVTLTAGAGWAGDPGASFMGRAPGSQGGNNGFDGNQGKGCADGEGGPAKSPPNDCPGDGGDSSGGPGGSAMGEQDGGPGETDPRLGEPNGEGSMTCTTGAETGEAGHDGPNGNAGGKGTTAGAVLSSSGYQGDPGKAGEDGRAGQGGGGGAARPTKINLCVNMIGYGGGSGGVGGCGGRAGGGGGAGGASIALLSLQSTLTLRRVTLAASTGGAGGLGGDLQLGGEGGEGGPGGAGATQACDGGPGGDGGSGGPGGGGAGGPSIGIAHTGAAPETPDGDVTITVATSASLGGNGGNGNMGDNRGEDGLVGQIQSF